jgi:hypothetical protein
MNSGASLQVVVASASSIPRCGLQNKSKGKVNSPTLTAQRTRVEG